MQGELDALNSSIQKSDTALAEKTKSIEDKDKEIADQKKTFDENTEKLAKQEKVLKTQSETLAKNKEEQDVFDKTKAKTQKLIADIQKNQTDLSDAMIVSQNEYDALVADISAARTKFDADKASRENFLCDVQQKIEENEPKLDEQAEVLNVLVATADAIKKENDAALLVVASEKAAALDEIAQSKVDTNNELKSLRVKISALNVDLQAEQLLVDGEMKLRKQLADENDAVKKDRADEKSKLDARAAELDKRDEILRLKEKNLEAAKRKALSDIAHTAEQKQIKVTAELIKSITE